jgi:hypothetical protein
LPALFARETNILDLGHWEGLALAATFSTDAIRGIACRDQQLRDALSTAE